MEMIIGGAFQGKEAYAKEEHPQICFLQGGELSEEELLRAEGVLNFQDYIRKEMKEGKAITELADKLIRQNPDVILVSEEVGYGVVPVDAFDRAFREAVGRVCTKLAAKSKKVTRVVCGIGTVIKHD
jgi:adenosylcobinamide kinase/adenosylcobinamide-phosphate guanylyltransferase